MRKMQWSRFMACSTWLTLLVIWLVSSVAHAQGVGEEPQGPPPAPVRVAPVTEKMVSDQITLVGTTEAIERSTVAAEVSGLVKDFPVREGDFVKKGELLAKLRSTDLALRLKAALATRGKVRANLAFSEKELIRYTKLKDADSIAASKYDEALYQSQALEQELLRTEAEIELLNDDIKKKRILAPFSGFVAQEHAQVGEWIEVGGPVVTLVDLERIKVTADVPERFAVQLSRKSRVRVLIASISDEAFIGEISGILPEGDSQARTFPVHVSLLNPGFKIKSGMETKATFNLGTQKNALLVPKDAIITAGTNRLIFVVASSVAQPVNVRVIGYYDGNVAVEAPIKPGDRVVIRGNERLMPGQPVQILE